MAIDFALMFLSFVGYNCFNFWFQNDRPAIGAYKNVQLTSTRGGMPPQSLGATAGMTWKSPFTGLFWFYQWTLNEKSSTARILIHKANIYICCINSRHLSKIEEFSGRNSKNWSHYIKLYAQRLGRSAWTSLSAIAKRHLMWHRILCDSRNYKYYLIVPNHYCHVSLSLVLLSSMLCSYTILRMLNMHSTYT